MSKFKDVNDKMQELEDSLVVFPVPARVAAWPEEVVQVLVNTTASLFWNYVEQAYEREKPLEGGGTFAEVVKTVVANDPTTVCNRSLIILDLPAPMVPEFFDRALPKGIEEEMWTAFEDSIVAEARTAVARIRRDIAAGVYAQ